MIKTLKKYLIELQNFLLYVKQHISNSIGERALKSEVII